VSAAATSWRIGVDVGGTFTDVCLEEERSGAVAYWKVPSTPDDPSRGMLRGIREALDTVDADEGSVAYLAHGTTVATNMLLERRGARTAILSTEGFRDQLEIARGQWPTMYDLHAVKPQRLVERELCFDVPERMLYDGSVHAPLDEDAVCALASTLAARGIEAIAVCFLHAYANPAHESRMREILAEEHPAAVVSLSSEVLREYREYERSMTTLVDAAVKPRVAGYVQIGRAHV